MDIELPPPLAQWLILCHFLPPEALIECDNGSFVIVESFEKKFVAGLVFHEILNSFCLNILKDSSEVVDVSTVVEPDTAAEWKKIYVRLNDLMINIVKQSGKGSSFLDNESHATSVSQLKLNPSLITSMRVLIALCRREVVSCISYAYQLMMDYYKSKEDIHVKRRKLEVSVPVVQPSAVVNEMSPTEKLTANPVLNATGFGDSTNKQHTKKHDRERTKGSGVSDKHKKHHHKQKSSEESKATAAEDNGGTTGVTRTKDSKKTLTRQRHLISIPTDDQRSTNLGLRSNPLSPQSGRQDRTFAQAQAQTQVQVQEEKKAIGPIKIFKNRQDTKQETGLKRQQSGVVGSEALKREHLSPTSPVRAPRKRQMSGSVLSQTQETKEEGDGQQKDGDTAPTGESSSQFLSFEEVFTTVFKASQEVARVVAHNPKIIKYMSTKAKAKIEKLAVSMRVEEGTRQSLALLSESAFMLPLFQTTMKNIEPSHLLNLHIIYMLAPRVQRKKVSDEKKLLDKFEMRLFDVNDTQTTPGVVLRMLSIDDLAMKTIEALGLPFCLLAMLNKVKDQTEVVKFLEDFRRSGTRNNKNAAARNTNNAIRAIGKLLVDRIVERYREGDILFHLLDVELLFRFANTLLVYGAIYKQAFDLYRLSISVYLKLCKMLRQEEDDEDGLSPKMREIRSLMDGTLFKMHSVFLKKGGKLEAIPLAALQVCSRYAGMSPGFQVRCLLFNRYNSSNYKTLVKAMAGAVYHGGVHEACIYHLKTVSDILGKRIEPTEEVLEVINEGLFTIGLLLFGLRMWKWTRQNVQIRNLIYGLGRGLGGCLMMKSLVELLIDSLD